MIHSRLSLEAPLLCANAFQLISGPSITIAERKHRVSVLAIQHVVCTYFRLHISEMKSARRSREVARPRQIAMYLCREFTSRSLPDIGRRFGDRDHTTVMHAIRQVEKLCIESEEVAGDVRLLRRAVEKAT